MKLIGYVISQTTVYKKNVCLEIVISENSCMLLLLVYSIPSTSDDYTLLHAWTIYKNDLKCAKKKQ